MNNYSLQLFTPIVGNITPSPIMSLNNVAQGWERSIRLNGGFWRGTFKVLGDPDYLQTWFDNYLGFHIEETSSGQTSWEGMIYEMEFNRGSVTRLRSLDDMANKVRVQYDTARTDWASETSSIATFGEKQEIIELTNSDSTAAENNRDTYLTRFAYPKSEAIGSVSFVAQPELIVKVAGYIFTLNWKYTTISDSTQTLSAFVTYILNNDTEYLNTGRIDTNALDAIIEADVDNQDHTPIRSWDVIAKDILPLGDSSNNIWRFYVDVGRNAFYHQLGMAPSYQLRGGTTYDISGSATAVNPFQVLPGVYRDLDYLSTGQEQGSIFNDVRDFVVDEVIASVGNKNPSLKTLRYGQSDLLDSMKRFINQAASEDGGGGGGGSGYNKWNWKEMTDEEKEWYISSR